MPIPNVSMENCCGCGVTMANLVATFFASGYDPNDYTFTDIFPGASPRPVKYLQSDIDAHDRYGHTFHQTVVYGRHNGAVASGTSRTNEVGGLTFNVDTHGGGAMHVSVATPTYIKWEWDGPDAMTGLYAGKLELTLSSEYTLTDFKADLDTLYGSKTLDDVAAGDVLHLSWATASNHGLPSEGYGETGLVWDSYDGRTLEADAETLVQVWDHPGTVIAGSEADRLGCFSAFYQGLIVRGLGITQHCYEEYDYAPIRPANNTCVEIDADGSFVVRLAPPPLSTTEAVYNFDRIREFHARALPDSGSPGCHCVGL